MRSIISDELAQKSMEKWKKENNVPEGTRVNMRVVIESILTKYIEK